MPKRSRSGRVCVQNVEHTIPVKIKEEIVDEEAYIKSEPIDNGYECGPTQCQSTKTVIVNENERNKEALESEIGLVSQLEIVKTEFDVDEVAVKEFREEIIRMSIDAAPGPMSQKIGETKKRKREHTAKKADVKNAPKNKEKQKKAAKKSTKKKKTPKSVEPLEIVIDGKKMVKCPFCSKTDTTRNRSLVKEHIRFHTGETPWRCSYCKDKFAVRNSLISHIASHHKKKKLKCQLCGHIFYEADELKMHELLQCVKRRSFECHLCKLQMNRLYMHQTKEHMRMAHTGETIFQCQHCPEEFITRCRLSGHLQRAHPETLPIKCSNCDHRFQDEEKCEKHQKYCLARRRLECYICQYSKPGGFSFEELKLHMRKHSGEKPHQCHLCFKYFPRTEALAQHLQRHRNVYNFQCSKCHRRLLSKVELEKHEQICKRRRYECHLCGFTKFGISINKFRRHFGCHTGVKTIECHGCTKSFGTYVLLAEHVYGMHPELISTMCPNCCHRFSTRGERDAHQSNCVTRRIECYICKRRSLNSKTLQSHMIQKHTGAQKFQCKLCPQKYQKLTNFTNHMRSHTKIGLVKCQYCSQQFNDMKYKKKHEHKCKLVYECYLCKKTCPSFVILHRTHMKTHLGAKPYDCRHCSTSIGSVRCYDLHVINKHLHLYKFQCNVCNGFVLQRKDFRAHQKSCMKGIRQSQGVIYFKCSLCGKGLARLPELKKHILSGECKNHPKKVR